MEQHQVFHIVISPGSRNMPLATSFANHPKFHCHPVTDERSAGFFAIGLSLSLQQTVAVCVTSGSALLNLASSVSEAFYQQIPLLVISADRPLAWIGQMDGQTLPQTGVFGSLIKKEVSLPEPTNETDEWFCNRLINEAILELTHHTKGPVHINVPITEPFFDCSVKELPKERVIRRDEPYSDKWNNTRKVLFIVGQQTKQEAEKVQSLLVDLNCPVFCEHLSNLAPHSNLISNADIILNEGVSNDYEPDLVIYFGGHIVSKRIKKWIRKIKPKECWRIDLSGDCSDTFQCLNNIIELPTEAFLSSLEPKKLDNDFLSLWKSKEQKVPQSPIDFNNYSALYVIKQVIKGLPGHSALILSNSSAVRYAQLFPIKAKDVIVSCNRGINGIDGSLSAAVGFANAQPTRDCFLLIGDLSFFYDMNGLWNTHLPSNLKIILINNGGGEIFRVLPGLEKTETTETFVMASHQTEAKGWVESVDACYYCAKEKESADHCIVQLFAKSSKTTVTEFFTDSSVDVTEYKKVFQKQ